MKIKGKIFFKSCVYSAIFASFLFNLKFSQAIDGDSEDAFLNGVMQNQNQIKQQLAPIANDTISNEKIIKNSEETAKAEEDLQEKIQKAQAIDDLPPMLNNNQVNKISESLKDKTATDYDAPLIINNSFKRKKTSQVFDISVKDTKDTSLGIAVSNLHKAYNAFKDGDYEVAIKYYDSALKEKPDSVEAVFGLATSYQMLLQYDQAIEMYLKLLEKNYSRKKVVANLLMALSHKSHKEALDILLSINDKILGYYDILAQIGVIYIKLGDDSRAISALSRAYELAPSNGLIAYNLGTLYDKSGNIDYAKHFYEQAIKNDITDSLSVEDGEELRNRIKQIDKVITEEIEKKKSENR